MTLNETLEWIYTNKEIESYIVKAVNIDKMNEMKSFLIEQIIDLCPDKLQRIISENYLKYYCLSIVHSQVYSKKSKYRQWYKEQSFHSNYEVDDSEVVEITSTFYPQQLIDIENELNSYHWHGATLFRLHYQQGLSIKRISDETTIDRVHVTKQIRMVREYLIEKLKHKDYGNDITNYIYNPDWLRD